MRTISPEELKTILENHKHWLYEDCEGWEIMRANLEGANLYRANLYRANLEGANLYREPYIGDWYYNRKTREWEYTGDEPEDEEDAD